MEHDGAQIIILGCTGMIDVAKSLSKLLAEGRGCNIPVIDPAMVALKFLEAFISLGLKQSKLTYMSSH